MFNHLNSLFLDMVDDRDLGAYYRRMQARLGAPKAITAAAHKLARLFYRLWTSGGAYTDPGIDAYEQQYRERTVKYLQKKAHTFSRPKSFPEALPVLAFPKEKQSAEISF